MYFLLQVPLHLNCTAVQGKPGAERVGFQLQAFFDQMQDGGWGDRKKHTIIFVI